MNLATTYLGLNLRNPVIVGASPCCDDLDLCKRLEQAGAAALVMHSLFEEQVDLEENARHTLIDGVSGSHAEASDYFPHVDDYALPPEAYVRQLAALKATLSIPVIASLNGHRPGGWIDYARRLEAAGADALELNLYSLPTDPEQDAEGVEGEQLFIVGEVCRSIKIPVAVKISPWLTAPAHYVRQLEQAGAKGVVMFNRLYQPDFDIEGLEVHPHLRLSDPAELLMRLRWLAIISPQSSLTLAASGGVHSPEDLIKSLLAGAHATQIVSTVLRRGPEAVRSLLVGLVAWMQDRGYENIVELRGALNHARCPNPTAFERANYLQILQSWRV